MIKYIDGRTIILCDRCGKEVINKEFADDDKYGYEPGDYWLSIVRHSDKKLPFSTENKNVLCYKCKGKLNKFFKYHFLNGKGWGQYLIWKMKNRTSSRQNRAAF